MFKVQALLIPFLLSVLLVACSQGAEVPQQLGAAASSPYTTYQWSGGAWKDLISTNEGFCWLSGLQGNFNSTGEQVDVNHYKGQWTLGGFTGGSEGLWAQATCVKWSAFKTPTLNASESVRWVSDTFSGSAPSCSYQSYGLWKSDAVSFVTGLGGNMAKGNGVRVIQGREVNEYSSLNITNDCPNDNANFYGRAHSVFIGKPHVGDMPQFWGTSGTGVPFSSARTYYAIGRLNQGSVEMAPTDKAFCYISYVFGNFDTPSDWAWIYRGYNSAGQEVWKLAVNNANASPYNDIGAYANCYMLTQY
jgi:hypothetical protein